MRRFLVAAFALVALAGCRGGDDFPSFDAQSTTTFPDGAQPGPAGTATSVLPGTGNAFCDFLRTYNERFGRFNAGLVNPQELRTVMNDAVAAVKDAEATAPADIKADLTTVRAGFESVVQSLEAVGFDITKLRLETLTILQSPAFLQASQRMDTYTRTNCL